MWEEATAGGAAVRRGAGVCAAITDAPPSRSAAPNVRRVIGPAILPRRGSRFEVTGPADAGAQERNIMSVRTTATIANPMNGVESGV